MTVFRKAQWLMRKLGNWPTTYMMSEAMKALVFLVVLFSQRLSNSLITVHKN